MINIDFEEKCEQAIALTNRCFLVKDKSNIERSLNDYTISLEYELAYNLGAFLSREQLKYVSGEDVAEFYEQVVKADTEGKVFSKPVQPYFPKLIKIENPQSIRSLISDLRAATGAYPGIEAVTREELYEKILAKEFKEQLDYVYLYKYEKKSILRKIIYFVFGTFLVEDKDGIRRLRIPRSLRRTILEEINKSNISTKDISSKEEFKLWRHLGRVLHAGEYKELYPESFKFFQDLSTWTREKREPKLHNLLEKAWKKGKESEVLETYLSEEHKAIDFLETIKFYENNPRISRFKRLSRRMIGAKNPSEFEKEMVDIIRLELKQKVLQLISNTGKSYSYPDELKSVPATRLLGDRKKIDGIIKNSVKLELSGDDECSFIVRGYNPDKKRSVAIINPLMVKRDFDNRSIILNKDSLNNPQTEEVFVFVYSSREKINNREIKVSIDGNYVETINLNYNYNSILAFVYDNNTIEYLGIDTKKFISGNPANIKDLGEFLKTPKVDNYFLSVYDVCMKLYGPSNNGSESVTMDIIKSDLL